MIYVVSGMVRSGTSMMMKALRAGGLPIYFSQMREETLREFYRKERNPGGYWEPSDEEREELDFPLQAEGKAVKILAPWLTLGKMPVHKYKILIMRRDPREIKESLEKLFQCAIPEKQQEVLYRYDEHMDHGIAIAGNRKDVISTAICGYDALLANPRQTFLHLKMDWPIDDAKAARVIKPSLRTCRVEVTA